MKRYPESLAIMEMQKKKKKRNITSYFFFFLLPALGLSCSTQKPHYSKQAGSRTLTPALGAWSLNHWTTREVLTF